ncbi:hypothetical protein [Micromonospora palomenae]|uniref:hypothetical protein n=1 Tax=Micromonospora palomenae TaxID=1461247 RepID=UPI003F88E18C
MVKISSATLMNLKIPLVPLPEQHKIIRSLSAVDGLLRYESQALAKERALLDGFVNATLHRHLQEFGTVQLGELSIGGGSYGSSSPAVPYVESGPRYVRITDIDEFGELTSEPGTRAGLPEHIARHYLLEAGDLLIARTGFTVGKSYLYRPEDGVCAYAGYLVRFRIDSDRILPDYAFLWSRGHHFKHWVAQNMREVGQRNISAREYETHHIPLPPIGIQRDLVAQWRQMRASIRVGQRQLSKLKEVKRALVRDMLAGPRCARVGNTY